MGFNTKVVQFWMIWGYSHFRKPPFMMRKEKSYQMSENSDAGNSKSLACRDNVHAARTQPTVYIIRFFVSLPSLPLRRVGAYTFRNHDNILDNYMSLVEVLDF